MIFRQRRKTMQNSRKNGYGENEYANEEDG